MLYFVLCNCFVIEVLSCFVLFVIRVIGFVVFFKNLFEFIMCVNGLLVDVFVIVWVLLVICSWLIGKKEWKLFLLFIFFVIIFNGFFMDGWKNFGVILVRGMIMWVCLWVFGLGIDYDFIV